MTDDKVLALHDAYAGLVLDGKEYQDRIPCCITIMQRGSDTAVCRCSRALDFPVAKNAFEAEVVFFQQPQGRNWYVRLPVKENVLEGWWVQLNPKYDHEFNIRKVV